MKKIVQGVLIFVLVFTLSACGNEVESEEETVMSEEQMAANEFSEIEQPEEFDVQEHEEVLDMLEQVTVTNMKAGVGSYVDVEFVKSEKTFILTPVDPQIIMMLELYEEDGEMVEEWNNITSEFVKLSEANKEVLGEGYVIFMVNPNDHSKPILQVKDGELLYSF